MAPWILPLLLAAAAAAPPDAGAGQGAGGASAELRGDLAPADVGRRHLDWLVVPIAKYDTDARFGYGGAAQLQGSGGIEPYRYQLSLQVMFTTAGIQSHFIRYDAPDFLGSPVRLLGRIEYYRQKFAPWYGQGDASSDQLRDHPALTGAHPFRYDEEVPSARLGADVPLGSNFYVFGFGAYRRVAIRPYAGSLLEAEQPLGLQGGTELLATVGVQHDTRDNEAVPTEGHLLELSARGAARGAGSAYTYGGLDARLLQFVPLLPWLVGALRLQGDLLSRGTPFYELPIFGGFNPIDGVGGEYTARGIPQDRYVGRIKALGTAELRTDLADWRAFGGPLSLGSVVFVDVGRVWSPGDPAAPTGLGLHPGYGAGLRLWRRAFVVRADAASSPDRPLSLYFVFGHFF